MKTVPFVDLRQQYQNIKTEIDQIISDTIEQCAFIRGPYVQKFEAGFKQLSGASYCVSCANGTDAIHIALKTLGIQSGDEVIVPALSWIASSETVSYTGGHVVFADIRPDDLTIDPVHVESLITQKTKAIIPVHLYGQSADMTAITAIAKKHGLAVIEDCAQAHLAEHVGQKVGTFGAFGTFSFYPGKNLGAYGDAGALVTQNETYEVNARMYANHGASKSNKHEHLIEGINSRMDGLQAAVLSVKMKYIEQWTAKRIANANIYREYLKAYSDIELPAARESNKHVYHLFVIKAEERDKLQAFLNKKGIATAIQYPTALPLLAAYSGRGYRAEDFPVASQATKEILSLPMYPELKETQIAYVAEKIGEFYGY